MQAARMRTVPEMTDQRSLQEAFESDTKRTVDDVRVDDSELLVLMEDLGGCHAEDAAEPRFRQRPAAGVFTHSLSLSLILLGHRARVEQRLRI